MATLGRDWERLVTFYDFPAEHWKHLRTSNVVESPFAAVRLRPSAAKRFLSCSNASCCAPSPRGSIASTQYYLPFVDALAQRACERFDQHCSRFLSSRSVPGSAR